MRGLQVIGDPVLHSLSPKLHGAMLARLGLDIPYTPRVVPQGGLKEYLAWAREARLLGFNATMPHKQALLPLMDELGEDARRCGAVNTVCLREGRFIGHNTDGDGCLSALAEQGLWPAQTVVVLGAGGAAGAVALALAAHGAQRVYVCNRTRDKAAALCAADPTGALLPCGFDRESLAARCGQAQLLINCTNLGMEGCGQFESLDFLTALPAGAGVFDLVYHPARTPLLAAALEQGHPASNGLPMLIHQAILALEYFLDRPLDRQDMAAAIRAALG